MKCVSLNNRSCQARPTLFDINSDETDFYPFIVSVNKYGGSFNTIGDPYTRVCVPNKVKNMNAKVFNLMSGVNETRFLVQHKCECRLNKSVCDSKQKWNHDEYRCKCKELDGWGSCKNYYMWNPSTCDWKYNKACKIDGYLSTKNCSCKKRLTGKLV